VRSQHTPSLLTLNKDAAAVACDLQVKLARRKVA
jgi:hypothetical protein